MPAVAHAQWSAFAPLLDPADARTNADAVERELQALLSANERRVVRLRYGVGAQACSSAVIARRLGVRITTIHRLHARALRKLRADGL